MKKDILAAIATEDYMIAGVREMDLMVSSHDLTYQHKTPIYQPAPIIIIVDLIC
jgi:hypothetical protein